MRWRATLAGCVLVVAGDAAAQRLAPLPTVQPKAVPAADAAQAELVALRSELARARALIEAQDARLAALERRVGLAQPAAPPNTQAPPVQVAGAAPVPRASGEVPAQTRPPGATPPLEQVGQAPPQPDRPPEVAVLGDQGSIVTRRGQLTGEVQLDYARADRNRILFRGIEVPESVLVGIFNISESRQDVLTASGSLRYGITPSLEFGIRLPFVYRADTSILVPRVDPGSPVPEIPQNVSAAGIGDIELSTRYQLTAARGGWPFLIANLQLVAPTGSDPFEVRRAASGEALEAATGAGFWAVAPSITAIMPTDPAVLFGTIGYTVNFGRNVNTLIADSLISRVDPGDALNFTGGIGIALNQRTTLNLGYAHTWAFGTFTRQLIQAPNTDPVLTELTSRDLQLGRLLFGVTYRMSSSTSLNWSVEVGATDDATDVRTSLRFPFTLLSGVQ